MPEFQRHPALNEIQGKQQERPQAASAAAQEKAACDRILALDRQRIKAENWDELTSILLAIGVAFVVFVVVMLLVQMLL